MQSNTQTSTSEHFEFVNSERFIFNSGFVIGIAKYSMGHRITDKSTHPFDAMVHGLYNGLAYSLMATFIPTELRFLIPIIDVTHISYSLIMKNKNKKTHDLSGPSCPDYPAKSI